MSLSIQILRTVDQAVQKVWRRVVIKYNQKNMQLLDKKTLGFKYNREYYTGETCPRSALRTLSEPLHESLIADFEEDLAFYTTEYQAVRGQLKHLMHNVLRYASEKEELYPLLPEIFHKVVDDTDYKPLKSAKGITPEIKQELLDEYQQTINMINAYVAVEILL